MSEHWEQTYSSSSEEQRSWTEHDPAMSLRCIAGCAVALGDGIIDVGGGASYLVDRLVALGYENVTVLDLSASALDSAQGRVGARATFLACDLFDWNPRVPVKLWHDRAVLHFITEPERRKAYVDHLSTCLALGGSAVIACFAPSGPSQCSSLPVVRASAEELCELFGDRYFLQSSATIDHRTPWGLAQPFTWVVLEKVAD